MADFGVPNRIRSQAVLDCECERLTTALQETIARIVPISEICSKSKRWWAKELKELRKSTNKLGRKASRYKNWPDHEVHAEYKDTRKKYDKAIKYNKRHHWRDWLEKATDPDLWTANKYISAPASDGGKTRIPNLKQVKDGTERTATTNQEKGQMLAKVFFPSKPTVNGIPTTHEYPPPICGTHKITKDQIRHQLRHLRPYKAPGPDGIPNIVLSKCANQLTDRLWFIYSAILERELYYTPWKQFTTVVLRKPGG